MKQNQIFQIRPQPFKEKLLKALLQQNYLPMSNKKKEELPPLFSSISFSIQCAKELQNITLRKDGYDYRLTRFNNIPRELSIPHPRAYTELCYSIYDNWGKLNHILSNKKSLLKPSNHEDGRIIISSYDSFMSKKRKEIEQSFGKKYFVKSDIKNFFHSIYSHSIPWALAGTSEAKNKKNKNDIWYNKLDQSIRYNRRKETNGIAIGPATSNIISEILLYPIDEELSKKGFNFKRYIDDYKYYSETYDDCEKFITDLVENLRKYNLNLNSDKTKIIHLPDNDDDWLIDLSLRLPTSEKIDFYKASRYIDYAVSIHKSTPSKSVLKYAVSSIASKIERQSVDDFAKQILLLAFHYPVLLPLLREIGQKTGETSVNFKLHTEELKKIIIEHSTHKRSDALVWSLYFLFKGNVEINSQLIDRIITTGDSLSITALLLQQTTVSEVKKFVKKLTETSDNYEMDKYWILLYESYLRGLIDNPYKGDKTFEIMKANNVKFLINPNIF